MRGENREWEVRWAIDIDAPCAEDAAVRALEIMRDPQSLATMFEVERRSERSGPRIRLIHVVDAAMFAAGVQSDA